MSKRRQSFEPEVTPTYYKLKAKVGHNRSRTIRLPYAEPDGPYAKPISGNLADTGVRNQGIEKQNHDPRRRR